MSLLNLILILRKTLTICWWLLLPGNSLATVFFHSLSTLGIVLSQFKMSSLRARADQKYSKHESKSKQLVWNHFLLAGLYPVILTKKTVDSQVCFEIDKVFQVSFKLWTTCVRQTHLSRPLSFHCASYSIWRCHIHMLIHLSYHNIIVICLFVFFAGVDGAWLYKE